jgi:predicted RNase H-like nuclease (RuvC/YqgF family)
MLRKGLSGKFDFLVGLFSTTKQLIMSKKAPQLSILRQHEQTITKLKDENQSSFDEIEGLKKENQKLKEQVSRGEIFRLREKIRLIEQDNKSYVLKLRKENEELKEEIEGLRKKLDTGTEQHLAREKKVSDYAMKKIEKLTKENEELKLYKDLKIKNWLNSAATIELKKDLEIHTRSRDKWRTIAKEVCDEIDVLLKENEKLKLPLRS